MDGHPVVDRDEWRRARLELLAEEKELTHRREAVAARRRSLPWVRVDDGYRFDTEAGRVGLADLFDGHGQLVVYHFMFGRGWDEGCPSCSFWADSFDGLGVHLAHRDTAFVAASRAALPDLLAYRDRMGWSFPWVSTVGDAFNREFGVSDVTEYNYAPLDGAQEELPGLSVFTRRGDGLFHAYSTYARGLDPFNAAYQLLDLTPAGRDEAGLPWTQAWVRRHDAYDD